MNVTLWARRKLAQRRYEETAKIMVEKNVSPLQIHDDFNILSITHESDGTPGVLTNVTVTVVFVNGKKRSYKYQGFNPWMREDLYWQMIRNSIEADVRADPTLTEAQ